VWHAGEPARAGCAGVQVNLHEQGVLVRQGELVVSHAHKRALRHVFLFDELVVFSKTRHSPGGHDLYLYKNSIKVWYSPVQAHHQGMIFTAPPLH